MSKFHLNPASGVVSRCTAQTKCRFGGESGEENHFASTAEARIGYENLMKNKTVPSTSVTKSHTSKTSAKKSHPMSPEQIETLISVASSENAAGIRSHLRILKHPDLKIAREMRSNYPGFAPVEAALNHAVLESEWRERHELIRSIQERMSNAPTDESRRMYHKQLEEESNRMADTDKRLSESNKTRKQHISKLQEQLSKHETAVAKLKEFQKDSQAEGEYSAPLARGLEYLPKNYKQISEGHYVDLAKDILTDVQLDNRENLMSAAARFGNSYHVDNADAYFRHDTKAKALSSKIANKEKVYQKLKNKVGDTPEVREMNKEISNLTSSMLKEERIREKYQARLRYFYAEVQDMVAVKTREREEWLECVEYGPADLNKKG